MAGPISVLAMLFGLIWSAASAWGDLQARVRELERYKAYMYGTTPVPR